jgi:hypothetical protein
MRATDRPSLAISTLSPLHLDLHEGKNAWIVCPDEGCGQWVEVHRGLVQVHRHEGVRCAGSKRHVAFDLSPAQHARRYAAAQRTQLPVRRTVIRLHDYQPAPTRGEHRTALEAAWQRAIARVPVAPAPHQIAARRALAAA